MSGGIMKKKEVNIKEAAVISFVTAWVIAAIFSGSITNLSDVNAVRHGYAFTVIFTCSAWALCSAFYVFYPALARLAMAGSLVLYSLILSLTGAEVSWIDVSSNPVGNVCLELVLILICSAAMWYVKSDISALCKRIRMGNRAFIISTALAGVFVFIFAAVIGILRYRDYSSSSYDFGIFAQMYEYMLKTGTMDTTVERSRLMSHMAVHISPVFYLTLPIYAIHPGAVTVLIIQALLVSLPVIPLAMLCRSYGLSVKRTVAVLALYALYPAVISGVNYDIHENEFLLFFIFFFIWAVRTKRNVLAAVFMICTFGVKEDAPFYTAVLGLYWLVSGSDRVRGATASVLSVVVFLIDLAVIRGFGVNDQAMYDRYGNLFMDGEGLFSAVKVFIQDPGIVITQLISNSQLAQGQQVTMDKWEFILLMAVPVLALAAAVGRHYSRLILLVPFVLINLLSGYVYQHSIDFQYCHGSLTLIFYMVIINLSELRAERARFAALVSLMAASVMFMGNTAGPVGSSAAATPKYTSTADILDQAVSLVPDEASVSASGFIVPHLSRHLKLYDQAYVNFYHETEPDFKVPVTDYLVVDERVREDAGAFTDLINSGDYEQIYTTKNVVSVYRRVGTKQQ